MVRSRSWPSLFPALSSPPGSWQNRRYRLVLSALVWNSSIMFLVQYLHIPALHFTCTQPCYPYLSCQTRCHHRLPWRHKWAITAPSPRLCSPRPFTPPLSVTVLRWGVASTRPQTPWLLSPLMMSLPSARAPLPLLAWCVRT